MVFLSSRPQWHGQDGKWGLQAVDTGALAAVLARSGKTLDDVRALFQFFERDAARLLAGLAHIKQGKLALGRGAAKRKKAPQAAKAKAKPAKQAATQAQRTVLDVHSGGVRKKARSATIRRARQMLLAAHDAPDDGGADTDADDSDDDAVEPAPDGDDDMEPAPASDDAAGPVAMDAQPATRWLAVSQAKQQGLFAAICRATVLELQAGGGGKQLAEVETRLSVRQVWDTTLAGTELPLAVRSLASKCAASMQADVAAAVSELEAAVRDSSKRVLAFEVLLDGQTPLFACSAELRGSLVMLSLVDSDRTPLLGVLPPAATAALWRAALLALLARAWQCGATRTQWVSCSPHWEYDRRTGKLVRVAYLLPATADVTRDVRGWKRADVDDLARELLAKGNAALRERVYLELIAQGIRFGLLADAGVVAQGAASSVQLLEDDLVTKKVLELARAGVAQERVPLKERALAALRELGCETFAATLLPPPQALAELAATYAAMALRLGGGVEQAVRFAEVAREAQADVAAGRAKLDKHELPGSYVRRAMHLAYHDGCLAQATAAAEE